MPLIFGTQLCLVDSAKIVQVIALGPKMDPPSSQHVLNGLVSTPEHEVLMVSNCGQSMSVMRRPLCIMRRQQLL